METLQKQISILSTKVDALYQLIEQLSGKVTAVATECKVGAEQRLQSEQGIQFGSRPYRSYNSMDAAMEHKDVLVDSNSLEFSSHSGERQIAPEIQIQRLTAQLTAAYNRIAALEEQLLSQRVHESSGLRP